MTSRPEDESRFYGMNWPPSKPKGNTPVNTYDSFSISMTLDPKLFDILVCPKCRGRLITIDKPEGFVCENCELFFAIDDGLPNMLLAEAKRWPLSDDPAS